MSGYSNRSRCWLRRLFVGRRARRRPAARYTRARRSTAAAPARPAAGTDADPAQTTDSCRAGASADAVDPRARLQRHAGVRRLVPRQGRLRLRHGRLLQPEHQGGIRHSRRAEQPHRPGRPRSGPADALSTSAASGACSPSSCRRTSARRSSCWTLVVNGQTNPITLHTPPDYIVEPYGRAGTTTRRRC